MSLHSDQAEMQAIFPNLHSGETTTTAGSDSEEKIESGTVISWDFQSGTGRILSDVDDQALFIHQVDVLFTGEGKRSLPVWHQVEYVRSTVNGSNVACKVSKTNRRFFHFEADENEPKPTITLPHPDNKNGEDVKNLLFEKLKQYQCVVTTNTTIETGKIYYFHGEYRYGVIIPDHDTDKRIFADADDFLVEGSYLNVRKGICVEYMTGKNKEGQEVAVKVTGPSRAPISSDTQVDNLIPSKTGKRKNQRGGANPAKRSKLVPFIPEGKNPISIFYEFANSCNPKRIPSIKLVAQNTRASGMVSDFTFEARLDDKPIATGRAKTKKDAKTYAAFYALEALNSESNVYKQELDRIKKGVPSVKKQLRNFSKRKWRPGSFSAPKTTSYEPISAPGHYLYQPVLMSTAVSPLTTYNPVSNTTSTSFMNKTTASQFSQNQPATSLQTVSAPASTQYTPQYTAQSYGTTNYNNSYTTFKAPTQTTNYNQFVQPQQQQQQFQQQTGQPNQYSIQQTQNAAKSQTRHPWSTYTSTYNQPTNPLYQQQNYQYQQQR